MTTQGRIAALSAYVMLVGGMLISPPRASAGPAETSSYECYFTLEQCTTAGQTTYCPDPSVWQCNWGPMTPCYPDYYTGGCYYLEE
jgi:hypothetical protein